MKTRHTAPLLALVLVAALAGGASAEDVTVITDAAGDANFANANGTTNLTDPNGPDTRPASIEGADIRNISFSTPYTVSKTFNLDGTVSQVFYTPTAFQVRIQTEGPIKPTFGPSLIFRVVTNINGCDAWFESVVRGSSAAATETEAARMRVFGEAGCPTAAVKTAGYTLNVTGNVITATYPLSADTGGLVTVGQTVGPDGTFINNANAPHVRTFLGGQVTAPTIDETARPAEFVVGSDVPAHVTCVQQPTHPECQTPAP